MVQASGYCLFRMQAGKGKTAGVLPANDGDPHLTGNLSATGCQVMRLPKRITGHFAEGRPAFLHSDLLQQGETAPHQSRAASTPALFLASAGYQWSAAWRELHR